MPRFSGQMYALLRKEDVMSETEHEWQELDGGHLNEGIRTVR